jgi:uncharacterized protein involved in type VI secretion and phage assembly
MMSSDTLGSAALAPERGGRIFGVVVGVVTDNNDTGGLGRVKVSFPWLSDTVESNWARVMAPMAGKDRGLFLLPAVGDEVLVMFENGRADLPYVMGALWNGADSFPTPDQKADAALRVLRSTSGHTITLDDTAGAEKITIVDKAKNSIMVDASKNAVTVTVQSGGAVTLSAPGGDVSISCNNFKVDASQSYTLQGGQGQVGATSGLSITCTAGVDVNQGALEVR